LSQRAEVTTHVHTHCVRRIFECFNVHLCVCVCVCARARPAPGHARRGDAVFVAAGGGNDTRTHALCKANIRVLLYASVCVPAQVPFGALSYCTRTALSAGLESTGVEKEIENEGDDAVYTLLPEVQTLGTCIPRALLPLHALRKLPD
jgi:hypothetical protein